ncbi:MAG: trypsin-like peptidase domain-containing protein [Methyloceanibacter sp.]
MLRRTRILRACLGVFFALAVLSPPTATGDDEQFTIHLEEDAPGYDYERLDPPSLDYCQSRCREDPNCKGFTFNRVKYVCFLKHNVSLPLQAHGEAVTGRKTSGNRFTIRRNKDAPGHDYERLDPPTLGECESLCGEDTQCRAFSYNVTKKVCFLKHKADIALIPHPDAITGVKIAEDSAPTRPEFSAGTGFAVSGDGLILTNQHVIDGCRVITVGGMGVVELIAQDRDNDLALLKGDGHPSPVAFRQAAITRGETVFATGYPLGGELGLNFTDGIVSSTTGPENDPRHLQFTAPIQPGNSGGPLLDDSGHVAGVVVALYGGLQNVNFALQGHLAQRFLRANGVEPLMASSSDELSPSEIAKRAELYTYRLTCLSDN